MGKTMVEKILSRSSKCDARAGEIVVPAVDLIMSHDGNRPQPWELLPEMGTERPFAPDRYVLVLDHYPSPTEAVAEVHKRMRAFAREHGCTLIEVGEGISHQVLAERGMLLPGMVVVGADSHTCTYGALGAFGTGVGSSDVAAALATGRLWFRVPETIRVECRGHLVPGVFAKDLMLHIAGRIGTAGATYMAVEFTGTAIETLGMDGRFTLSNMAIEIGAKVGLVPNDAVTDAFLAQRAGRTWEPVIPDPDAGYADVIEVDGEQIEPMVSLPHEVDRVMAARELSEVAIHQVVIGTCTAARPDDLAIAARVLAGRRISPKVRLFVVPPSRNVLMAAMKDGTIQTLVDAGAIIGVPGCSGCIGGAHFAVPADGENVITTANRNFKGRLGNPNAFLYLSSPATAAASALTGRITDPRQYLEARV